MRTFFALLLLSVSLHAQTPYLVKDINFTNALYAESSRPWSFTGYRDRIYFVATLENQSGSELWSTDGTSAGTKIVADLLPGPASSNPSQLTVVNDVLLYSARDVNHGIELWTTDGTAAGTKLFLDLNPGPNSANPSPAIVYKNRLYFVAHDEATGRELWTTDGTAAGTRQLKDLAPGTASSNPRYFVEFGGSLYFAAGTGLWKTDGTEAGTVLVKNVVARFLAVAGSRMFLEGYTPESHLELWTSDGTEAGTRMLVELAPGAKPAFSSSYSQGFTVLGNRVLFLATDDVHGRELWISDGTVAGTRMLRDFLAGTQGLWDNRFLYAVTFDGRTYFTAEDAERGQELWVTDGTSGGTQMFMEFTPGAQGSAVYPLQVIGDRLLLTAGSSVLYGPRLWATDGTVEGTRMLRAADGSGFGYDGNARRAADGKLYFAGEDPLHATEPWVTDGTDAGTRRIANLAADIAPSSTPRLLTATDGLLFFHATEGLLDPQSNAAEASLWRSDGTPEGTFKLRETGQHPSKLTGAGRYVFFDDEEDRNTLMMSDGTHEGTRPANEFRRRFGGASPEVLYPFGDTLFVSAGSSTPQLWRTSPEPDAPAVNLGLFYPSDMIEIAGRYMFFASASSHSSRDNRGLWITDGTREGTYGVVPVLGNDDYGLSGLAHAGGTAYFVMRKEDEETARLWKSDGTLDGTVAVKELPVHAEVEIEGAGRRIFFATRDALWTSDGTAEGTMEVAKADFPSLRYEDYLKPVGNRVVFRQDDSDTDAGALWGSDGTPAGTKMLARLGAYAYLHDPIEDRLYFAGADDEHGTELWTSDGTVEGTKLLVDLNPGPGSSNPDSFTKVGNTLYFSAYERSAGAELWALTLTEPRLSVEDVRADESASVLRFTVALAAASTQTVTVDYATSDGTAIAGQDYESASGKLTFAPGETAKTVDVRLLGDNAPENNETLLLALRNASGARLLKGDGAGIIDDDDQSADLDVAIVFRASSLDLYETLRVGNHGPRGATSLDVKVTNVPIDPYENACYGSNCTIAQIASGASAEMRVPSPNGSEQAYRSAIVSAHQDDPNPSNNTVSWTVNRTENMSMNAAYLTTGASATITLNTEYLSQPLPTSSNPSVVAITSAVTKHEDDTATFTVNALTPGTSSIEVGGHLHAPLVVTVVAPGTSPRWPGALRFSFQSSSTRVDRPLRLTIQSAAAPVTGATATGTVTVSAFGQELARATLTGSGPMDVQLPLIRRTGSVQLQIAYSGDANFLPQTATQHVYIDRGRVGLTGRLEPAANGGYTLKVIVDGAPEITPTGTVSVLHEGTQKASLLLSPSSPSSTATAETTLTGLPDSPTITLSYGGDHLYAPATQEIRLTPSSRRRHVRH